MQHTMNLDNKETINAIEVDQNGLSSNNNSNGILLNGKKNSLEETVEHVEIKSKTDREIVRLIGQHLRGLGLNRTAELLSQESGCKFDHPIATRFYNHVIEGEWAKAESDLNNLQNLLDDPQNAIKMKFLLLEQKYFEFLDEGRTIDALYSLRHEITTLNYNLSRVHELSRYIMCNNTEELRKLSDWEGKGSHSRQKLMDKLQTYLPPRIMLPPRRLKTLLNQSLEYQKSQCRLHNSENDSLNLENFTLLTDHCCPIDDFPSETRQILTDHCDEVLYCQFSNDGTKLATGSKDNNIIIWDVNTVTLQCKNKFVLEGHTMGASFFVWSPNDNYIIACGPEESPNIWVWNAETGRLRVKVNHSSEDSLTTCCFQSNGEKFFVASTKGQFYLSDLDGNITDRWEGVRIQALATKTGDKRVLAADNQRRIKEFFLDSENPQEINLIQEDYNIMSFTVDKTEELALLNVYSQGVHLWDLKDKVLLKKYQGIKNEFYIIHSCFGGQDQNFIASGSEDCNVYIWHKDKEKPIIILNGHTQTVNCVSWNPKYPHILASVSDDRTVRIWGPSKKIENNKSDLKCNGNNQKNKSSVLSNFSDNNFNAAKPSCSSRSNVDCNQSESDTESNDPNSNSSSPLMA